MSTIAGSVGGAGTAQTTQVYSVFIRATSEQIWDAITKPEFTERYFHGVRVELRGGRRFSTLGDLEWAEEILESDPPRRLVHRWTSAYDPELAAEEPSRVTWEIEPREHGTTLLTVVHDRLDGAPKTAESVSGTGWMFVLSNLKTFLETGEPLHA
ncbi:MAG TPA: SRPBCC domain-containing protein [Gaiellaceae bacterium]|nr:SRPBCC domain-containing protein [Gaiellaceae bacterium]